MATEQPPSTGAGFYSHDETVAAITSYYKLVSRALAVGTNSTLLYPPPEGWPQLTNPDVVAGLGLSDEAISLIRHIPYFKYIEEDRLQLAAIRGKSVRNGESEQASNTDEDSQPPHLMKLGNVIMGNYHCQVQFDANDASCDGICPDVDDHSYDNLFSAYGQKGEGCSWRIGTFFASSERSLRELGWLPGMDEGDGGWIIPNESEAVCAMLDWEHRKQIMRHNGWPGDD
ncbi:hypothetical protein F4781DRAFT_439329 [Annulohypoxylon bovei var. microspora]|nr:hypothetical protein F4781DRAFT_439329 [Annulohypoxylon bovei var. microspora]